MASIRAGPEVPRRTSIRSHLLGLVLVVALPLAALEAWNLHTGALEDAQRAREHVIRLAQFTASETARFLGQTRNILNGLAARPAVRALDPARCDPILKDFLGLAPRFSNVLTVRIDGRVVCSAVPLAGPIRVDLENFLNRLREPGQIAVGKITGGTITGRWAVPVGLPLIDAQGGIAGAVALTIDLLNVPLLPTVQGVTSSTVIGLIDSHGTVLAYSKDPKRFVGTAGRAETRVVLRERHGIAEQIGLDGILRVRGFTPVPGADWLAIASLPASEVYAGVKARIAASALLAIAILAAALLLAVRWSRLIQEPIAAVASAADQVAAGNLAARAPVAGAAEIASVATQFNRMLDARARAEAVLRESTEKLRLFVDFAPSAIAMFDRDMRYIAFSRRWLSDYNVGDRDLTGLSHYEVFPDLPERWKEIHRRCLAGAVERAEEDPFPRADGSVDWVRWQVHPWHGGGGIGGVIIFSEVITDRKRAEDERLAAAERFLKVFRAAPLPMSIIKEETGSIMDVNDAFCALFGYAREEAIGRTTVELGLWVDPADRQAMTDLLRTSPRVRDFEARRRLRSGELRDIVINTDRIEFGGETCILSTLNDVTERRAAEREIREAHDRFQKIFHSAPLPAAMSNFKDGRLLEVNDAYCALVGLPRGALIGRSALEVGVWSDPRERAALIERLNLHQHVKDLEVHLRGGAGEVRDVLMSAERIDLGGEPCLLQIGTDITERKQVERKIGEQLEELRRWYQATLGREGRVLQLKREVNELLERGGQPARYSSEASAAERAAEPPAKTT